MQALYKNKLLIGFTVLFAAALFIYNTMLSPTTPVPSGESALAVGQDLLKLSNELSRAHLSQDLFNIPGYVYLADFSLPVPQQSFGRTNPFDIIGRE